MKPTLTSLARLSSTSRTVAGKQRMKNYTKIRVPATSASTTASALPGISTFRRGGEAELSLAPRLPTLLPSNPIQCRPCSSLADAAAAMKYNIQNSTVEGATPCRFVHTGPIFPCASRLTPSIIRTQHAHLGDSCRLEWDTLLVGMGTHRRKFGTKPRTGKR